MSGPVVLLVEDNADDEEIAVWTLRRCGVTRITVARDGAAALAMLHGSPPGEPPFAPDLVFLDLRLPKIDGIDVLAKIRADPRRTAVDSARGPIPHYALSRGAPLSKILLLLFLMPGFLLADIVYLKGGSKLTGRITELTAEKVTVDVGGGLVGVSMDRVEQIVKGISPLDEYDARAGKLGPQDVDGWRSLGLWASTKGLSNQSRAAYQRVLALAPDDAEARQALGYVKLDGRWVTEEESYRARGFVKYEGEWMTPAEVQLAQSTAAAEQAREDAQKRASDAEFAATENRLRSEEDKKRAAEADEKAREAQSWTNPAGVVFGGWGYSGYWPATPPAGASK